MKVKKKEEIGNMVYVDGDLEYALQRFERKVHASGIMQDIRIRSHFENKREKRRRKAKNNQGR